MDGERTLLSFSPPFIHRSTARFPFFPLFLVRQRLTVSFLHRQNLLTFFLRGPVRGPLFLSHAYVGLSFLSGSIFGVALFFFLFFPDAITGSSRSLIFFRRYAVTYHVLLLVEQPSSVPPSLSRVARLQGLPSFSFFLAQKGDGRSCLLLYFAFLKSTAGAPFSFA